MNIDQAIHELIVEKHKNITSRFPCRAVMVRNLKSYTELLDKLQQIPDIETVPSSSLFSGSDIMPRYENLTAPAYTSKWIILPGVSEYLRLFWRNEAETRRFAKLLNHHSPSDNTGRIIIPLLDCEPQWHDQSLHLAYDIRQQDFYFDCMDHDNSVQQMKLVVFADSFSQYADNLTADFVFNGLKEWYEYWANPSVDHTNLALITARYKHVQSVSGSISVSVVQDTMSFLQENLSGGKNLTANDCPSEAQSYLFDKALLGCSVDNAILSCLNVSDFAPDDVMGRWDMLSIGQKQLVALWYKLHNDNSYLCHCMIGAETPADIEERVLHRIFRTYQSNSGWIAESQKLIRAMQLERDDEYFDELDKVPEYSQRLSLLSCDTGKERSYLLHMVGLWLREDDVLTNADLKSIYPALGAYLNGNAYDEELRRYMQLYKVYKLSNKLPDDEQIYFCNIQPDKYNYRYSILSDNLVDDSVILWVDAMGVEWLPLLLWALSNNDSGTVQSFHIGQANLPTETKFNRQWEQMNVPYRKLDKLDKLAHNGIVDDRNYYSCVEEQIRFVTEIAGIAEGLLQDYRRVIITGDHGTSRLAARFFHKREGIPLPKDWKAFNHGRYALVSAMPSSLMESQVSAKDEAGNQYIIFKNYDHFVQSGFAAGSDDDVPVYGEVHGGAAPEEVLVPIIVFDSKKAFMLQASWKHSTVKIMMKKVTAVLSFNQPVKTLEAKIGTVGALTVPALNGKEWTVTFSGIKEGRHSVSVSADGKLVAVDDLNVLSALGNTDGDLP